MTIPKYDELYNVVLKVLSDGKNYNNNDIVKIVSDELNLSEEERLELLPSKTMTVIKSRIGWSRTYLKNAGLIESKKRNYSNITEEGLRVFDLNVDVNNEYLMNYESFVAFTTRSKTPKKKYANAKLSEFALNSAQEQNNLTPEESLDVAYSQINNELASNLLDHILENSPIFFERLVVQLLLNMGYGDFREDAGFNTLATNDEGIDGIINEDKLGLEKIGIQAKRYARDNIVGRPLIQSFVGALMGKHLNKGVFITSSSFSSNAIEYAESQVNLSIVLIDGDTLANLMIEHDLGVSTEKIYRVKKLDSDFFDE